MNLKQLSSEELYKMYFDYACRLVTWDLDACKPYRDAFIGDFNYRCSAIGDKEYQVALGKEMRPCHWAHCSQMPAPCPIGSWKPTFTLAMLPAFDASE